MHIRALTETDAADFHATRLQGLAAEPTAFASSYEEEVNAPLTEVARRLQAKSDGAIFGAFEAGKLIGLIGVRRDGMKKLSHKAYIWGMYVAPAARGRGLGTDLLNHALAYSWTTLEVSQVNLGVHSQNESALRLYKRLGFEIFGTERAALCVEGSFQDEHHMVCRAPGAA
jgi:RimJ/RimL family protein N-acetyltransferase